MKEFLAILVLSLVCLFGCDEPEVRAAKHQTYLNDFIQNGTEAVEYNGHQYYMYLGGHAVSIWHNPDCKYCKVKQ